MKTVKKLVSVVLIGAMALSMAACGGKGAKKVAPADFKSKLEAEGYTVVEATDENREEGVKTQFSAIGTSVMISYSEYENKDDAKEFFDMTKDSAKKAKDDGEIDKLSTSSSRICATSEDSYIEFVYADDMIIMAMGGGENGKSDVADALKILGL
ncbi:MAG: hypothetical protein J6T40_07000 [Clostridiales bacterium]|nr:hypothetical protein [Clostridiales bacterium]